MVVEDDSFMLLFLTQLFEANGYDVFPVYGHNTALSSAVEFKPDVIVLDISLNDGYTGYDVSQQLQHNETTKDIPTVFLTAEEDEESRCKAFMCGGTDFLRKPFNKQDLLNRVKPLAMIGKMSRMLNKITNKERFMPTETKQPPEKPKKPPVENEQPKPTE
jgi:two-component system cell cycle response regulator